MGVFIIQKNARIQYTSEPTNAISTTSQIRVHIVFNQEMT